MVIVCNFKIHDFWFSKLDTGGIDWFRQSPYLVQAQLCKHKLVLLEPHNLVHISHMLLRPMEVYT